MDTQLADALAAVWPAPLAEADIRLAPWAEFPLPSGTFQVLAKPGTLLLDVPALPTEESA